MEISRAVPVPVCLGGKWHVVLANKIAYIILHPQIQLLFYSFICILLMFVFMYYNK